MLVRRKLIRTLVEDLLLKNNIVSPAVPVVDLAYSLGAVLAWEPTEDSMSGFLYKDVRQNKIVIGVNSANGMNRQRFTIAHEIGHLLLHAEETLHVDKGADGFQINLQKKVFARNEESAKGTDRIEREANSFAAELLMPADFIERDMAAFGKIDVLHGQEIPQLAEIYEVSERAMMYRLANLKYIQI